MLMQFANEHPVITLLLVVVVFGSFVEIAKAIWG